MLPLAMTAGDPSGIGTDIALMVWCERRRRSIPPFLLVGDPDQIALRARRLGLEVPVAERGVEQACGVFDAALPVVRLAHPFLESPGAPLPGNAAGTIESIDRAVEFVVEGRAAAVVTLPVAKKPLYEAGFAHPGQTEYLGELAERHFGRDFRPVMMLAGPELRTVPVTIHIPISAVPSSLTSDLIATTARIVAADLRQRFAIASPRLAVLGLNPHAGEGGTIGTEDIEIVLPAVETLRREGIDAFGPLPADTMFHARARAGYDAAICMYHDQALIPAKMLGFDDAVNVTLGLPFVRTSPDHGTAFDLAGTGTARPDSLVAALKLARFLSENDAAA